MKTLQFLFIFLLTSFGLNAQTISWDGTFGDGISWSDNNNWVPARVPNSSDYVVISTDSVVVDTDVTIKQIRISGNGILYQHSPGSETFMVQNSLGDGVKVEGNGRLYIEGNFEVNNSASNGIYLGASGKLTGMPGAEITVDDCNQDGIKGVTGSQFINSSVLSIRNYSADGMDLTSFTNYGKIIVEGGGITGAVISGSTATNHGIMECAGSINIQTSTLFTNDAGADLNCTAGGVSVGSDFDNFGNILIENTSGNSLSISSSSVFNNYGNVVFRLTDTDNVFISNNSQLINHTGAYFRLLPLLPFTTIPDAFALVIQDPGSLFDNRGEADLHLISRREGIKILNRGAIINTGTFYVKDFYKKGFISEVFGVNTVVLSNEDEGVFKITGGVSTDAIAMLLEDRNDVLNEECADLILDDSLYMANLSVDLDNYGYMQIEKFDIHTNATFDNAGALYIADTSLADGAPAGYLDDLNNTGLVYHPLRGPIQSGQPVSPLFADFNGSNIYLPGGLTPIYVVIDGIASPSLTYNENANSWGPGSNANEQDTIRFEFRVNTTSPCSRQLYLPFIPFDVWDCSSAPPATVVFTGAISEDWHTADNWSNNQIPRPCDSVIIPHETKCTIFSGMTATAKTILVQDKAVFETNNNVVLTVDPNYP